MAAVKVYRSGIHLKNGEEIKTKNVAPIGRGAFLRTMDRARNERAPSVEVRTNECGFCAFEKVINVNISLLFEGALRIVTQVTYRQPRYVNPKIIRKHGTRFDQSINIKSPG